MHACVRAFVCVRACGFWYVHGVDVVFWGKHNTRTRTHTHTRVCLSARVRACAHTRLRVCVRVHVTTSLPQIARAIYFCSKPPSVDICSARSFLLAQTNRRLCISSGALTQKPDHLNTNKTNRSTLQLKANYSALRNSPSPRADHVTTHFRWLWHRNTLFANVDLFPGCETCSSPDYRLFYWA